MRPDKNALLLITALVCGDLGHAVAQTPPDRNEPATHEKECRLAVTNDMRLNQKLETLDISVSPPTEAVLKDHSRGFEGYSDLLMLVALAQVADQPFGHVYLCGAIRDPSGTLHRSQKFLYRQALAKK